MSPFHSLDISNPLFEIEGLRCATVKSRALKRRGDLTLFIPSETKTLQDVAMVLLLHGVYGSHWNWTFSGGAHRLAKNLIETGRIEPMVLVMPSDGLWGDGSGYLKHPDSDYEQWIVDEVIQVAIEVGEGLSSQSKVFISGLSMGGFGALRLGAKYPERFAGISAHSSITEFQQIQGYIEETPDQYGPLAEEDEKVFFWMKRNRGNLPPFRFDCGTEDPLLESNRRLHVDLIAEGIEHIYEEFPGAHTWDYWRDHLAETLLFFNSILSTR